MEPPPPPPSHPSPSSMETSSFSLLPFEPNTSSSSPWDWSDFLDFILDSDQFDPLNNTSLINPDLPPSLPPPPTEPGPDSVPDRVRKRDPRLTCPNYIARVPCSCPELDEEKAEEEEGLPGKKRVRAAADKGAVVRAVDKAAAARCQVPACGADIKELKGYHKRRRVCLRCANAGEVVLDGVRKRYCQQCGK